MGTEPHLSRDSSPSIRWQPQSIFHGSAQLQLLLPRTRSASGVK